MNILNERVWHSIAKKAKPTFPSGLFTNWKAKSKTTGGASSRGKLANLEGPIIGGLNDDDAAAVQPEFSKTVDSNLKSRQNNVSQLFIYKGNKGLTFFIQMVEIMDDSEDEAVVTKSRPKPIPRNKQVAKPTSAPASEVSV